MMAETTSRIETERLAPRQLAVRVRGAEARHGDRLVFSGVDVDIMAGEFAAILGPNGTGKSTFITGLLGLGPMRAAEVSVLGLPPGRAGTRVGYVPQRRHFDASVRLRGLDIVRLGLDGHRWGIPLPAFLSGERGRREAEQVREVVRLVGAEAYAHRAIGELSGGEQQRLLIAQALVSRPELLILDEPLDSLDLPNQGAIAALLGDISKRLGVTVVIVAHDVNPVLDHLDRVIYFVRGTAASGTPGEIINAETLTSLYGTRVEVLRTSDGHLVVVGHVGDPHGDAHVHLVP
jgi:zinc/manganese transport system ATP-binding protein